MDTIKWDIGWGPVSKCNMHCQFCYSKSKRSNSASDLSLEKWLMFIDNNHSQIKSINYGTGENSLSPDWFSLIEHIRRSYPEITQAVTSNGYLSEAVKNPRHMRIFLTAIDEVDISLDFCDPERHGLFRGQKNAYYWAINAMKLCQDSRKRLTLVFLGSAVNTQEKNIDGLFEIAKKYNAIVRMNIFRPMNIHDHDLEKFILRYQDVLRILQHISERYQVLSLSDPFFSALFSGADETDPSGSSSLRILANGDVTPSTYLIDGKYVLGNISDPHVLSHISQHDFLIQMKKKNLPHECENCILAARCRGGVIDRRYLWYNTLEKPDPYCPGRFESYEQLPPRLKFSNKVFNSVHDGYLPTMFFQP